MKQQILRELEGIEAQYGVRILYAAESGSRAWGFASPDSDYDVRFIYARPLEDYLRLDEPRDVIEWKLDDVLDINGWDLRKAMKQFAGGNVTLAEWSLSPIIYRTSPEWTQVQAVGMQYFSEKKAMYHYYAMAAHTWAEHLTGETVRYKKYFYALRPLLAARYIERYHAPAPVLFDELLLLELEPPLRAAIDDLLERKKAVAEGAYSPHLPVIQDFLRGELTRQKALCARLPRDEKADLSALNRCFADIVKG